MRPRALAQAAKACRTFFDEIRAKRTRCQICQEILFVGPSDPLDRFVATGGEAGWGGVPLAVCVGSWRNLWNLSRRKWYHQTCSGVYTDRTDRAGRWHVFGFTPPEEKQPPPARL